MKAIPGLVAVLLLAGCSLTPSAPATSSTPTPSKPVKTASVVGYVIVEADYLGTLQVQRSKGGAACANAAAGKSVTEGSQVVVKDANGTAIDVLTLGQGYAQFPVGHTDASPVNELACVYAFRNTSLAVPSDILSFELTGYPAVAVKVPVGSPRLWPQILVGNIKGLWSSYKMTGD